MLVIRTKHFRLGLTPARRSGHTILHVQLLLAQSAERELGMAWLWPERLDIVIDRGANAQHGCVKYRIEV